MIIDLRAKVLDRLEHNYQLCGMRHDSTQRLVRWLNQLRKGGRKCDSRKARSEKF